VLFDAHADCIPELPDVRMGKALDGGDSFELGTAPDGSDGWKLEVLHVPGHAHGHLAFQESRYRAVIVGDLVSTLSSILVDPSDGHLASYLRSLDELREVATGTLYPGHGPPVPDGKRVIEKTLRHRAEREEQLVAALTKEPQSSRSLVEAIYTDLPEAMHGLAERSLLSGLLKLEEEGRIRRTEAGQSLV
jgi:ribonuclease/clavin/mitogillin